MARRIHFDVLGEALYGATSAPLAPASIFTSSSGAPGSTTTTTMDHSQSLLANLIARVICAIVGTVFSWVPFRLLLRNGELAAVVLIAAVAAMNLITVANSLIWRTDDWTSWWDGAGLCDVEVYVAAPLDTAYAAAVFALMRHLAGQMKRGAAPAAPDGSPGARRQRRRKMLVQAAIIFPVPLFQLVFTYFDLAQRYLIVTLIGCSAVYDNSLPTNLVYDIPPAIFAVAAVPYAVLTFRRFWRIRKETRATLGGNIAALTWPRRPRPNLRLYLMCLAILVAYFPVMGVYLAANVAATLHPRRTYDYHRIHFAQTPYPWGSILFVPSWLVPSLILNQPWIPIATSAAIVGFFGTGAEAVAMYRWYAGTVFGLGKWFPGLVDRKSRRGDAGKKEKEKKDSPGWWRKWFSRDRERAGSRKRILDLTDDAAHGIWNESPRPRDNRPLSPLNIPKRGPILPTVKPSYQQASPPFAQASPYLPSPLAASTPTAITGTGPPAIPPRDSSLRWRFVFPRIFIPSVSLPSLPESISGSLSSLVSRSPISPRSGSFGFGGFGFRKTSGGAREDANGDEGKGKGKDKDTTAHAGSPAGRSFSYPLSSYHSRLSRRGGGGGGYRGRTGEDGNDNYNDSDNDFVPMLPLQTFNVPAPPPQAAVALVPVASRAAVDALPDVDSLNSTYPRFGPGPGPYNNNNNSNLTNDGSSSSANDSSAQYIRIPIVSPSSPKSTFPFSPSSLSPSPLSSPSSSLPATATAAPQRLHERRPHQHQHQHQHQRYNSSGRPPHTHTHIHNPASHNDNDDDDDDDDGFETAHVIGGGGGGGGVGVGRSATATRATAPGTTTTVITGGERDGSREKQKPKPKPKQKASSSSASVAATAGSASGSRSGGGSLTGSLQSGARKRKRDVT